MREIIVLIDGLVWQHIRAMIGCRDVAEADTELDRSRQCLPDLAGRLASLEVDDKAPSDTASRRELVLVDAGGPAPIPDEIAELLSVANGISHVCAR
nr:hypothetical protein [Bosea sp. RAC05]